MSFFKKYAPIICIFTLLTIYFSANSFIKYHNKIENEEKAKAVILYEKDNYILNIDNKVIKEKINLKDEIYNSGKNEENNKILNKYKDYFLIKNPDYSVLVSDKNKTIYLINNNVSTSKYRPFVFVAR